jgi:hypothetical protein
VVQTHCPKARDRYLNVAEGERFGHSGGNCSQLPMKANVLRRTLKVLVVINNAQKGDWVLSPYDFLSPLF